ncbi:hypothetical protein Tsubulata_024371 [Turnera subulata]|uniref:Uncharacterized protein n=1 Tax=Turnera subulata TaxID=218843 RepID=A0A9Q0GKG9_9ROSI|nr:hypothetical protein Tsubulata_024371 [Turnera subulata]
MLQQLLNITTISRTTLICIHANNSVIPRESKKRNCIQHPRNQAMASFNFISLALFIALCFTGMNSGLAARHLLQLPPLPSMPNLPKPAALPPLPTIPATLPQPTLPTLPTTQPAALPKPTLPPLPSFPSLPTLPKGKRVLAAQAGEEKVEVQATPALEVLGFQVGELRFRQGWDFREWWQLRQCGFRELRYLRQCRFQKMACLNLKRNIHNNKRNQAMASFNRIALALFIALCFSSMNAGLAARHLLQMPSLPSLPNLPKPAALPPLPTIPATLPQPALPTLPTTQPALPKPTLPPLPSFPSLPTIPKVTLPPLPSMPSIPTIPTTIPSIPFLSPPPAGN